MTLNIIVHEQVNEVKLQWRCDRFKVKVHSTEDDAIRNLAEGTIPSKEVVDKTLHQILKDKRTCDSVIKEIIKNMLVTMANASGIRVTIASQGTTRMCATTYDVIQGMRTLPIHDRLAMLQFLTNYAGGLLYQDTLGVTHQEATEDAVCEILHVSLGRNRKTIGIGKKTCIGQLYGLVYNRQKHRFQNSVLRGTNTHVSVEHGLVPKPKNWKRNKHVYFIHEKTKNTLNGKMEVTQSKEVSNNRS
jgi:hypothetical protein